MKTGHGARDSAMQPADARPAAVVETLLDAAEWIVRADEQTIEHDRKS